MEETTQECLRQLEECLLQTDARRSVEVISNLLLDDFVEFGGSGRVYNKQQVIETLPNEEAICFFISGFCVKPITDGAALVTYRAVRSNGAAGTTSESLRSSVWVIREGKWQMLFHQGTPIQAAS